MIIKRQIYYSGRVQGVGFRYTVKQIARGYEMTGWVCNLADGRVELQVKGEKSEIDSFLEAVSASHLQPHIHGRQINDSTSEPGNGVGFEIRS